jgi:Fe-S cluster biogenesis protein NfuA
MDHCRFEIVTFVASSGELILKIDGECTECEMSPATFSPAIAAHVKLRVPEVRDVKISA